MTRKWLKLLFYCALLSISFLTDFFSPATKQLFCTPLQPHQETYQTPQLPHAID
jgi:hypothetical protein